MGYISLHPSYRANFGDINTPPVSKKNQPKNPPEKIKFIHHLTGHVVYTHARFLATKPNQTPLYISYNLYKITIGPNIFINFIDHSGKEEKYFPKLALLNGRTPYAQSVNEEKNRTINMFINKKAKLYVSIVQIFSNKIIEGKHWNSAIHLKTYKNLPL